MIIRSEKSGRKLWPAGPYQHDRASIRIRDHILVFAIHPIRQAPQEKSCRSRETIVYPTNDRDRISRQPIFTGLLPVVSGIACFL
jgi:hypothetical protein